MSQTLTTLEVKSIIYPTYDTRGSLAKAVEAFVDWLTTTCVEMECKPAEDNKSSISGRGKGAASVKIILCGHSMGGLVAVDASLEIAKSGGIQKGKLWPRVCGVIAYDTPVSIVGFHQANTATDFLATVLRSKSKCVQAHGKQVSRIL